MLSDDEEGLVILSDRSWISDRGTYNSIKGVFTPFDEEAELPEGYLDEINARVNARFKMSNLILSNDYYNHIGLNDSDEETTETEQESD